jgi:hypothetical protein
MLAPLALSLGTAALIGAVASITVIRTASFALVAALGALGRSLGAIRGTFAVLCGRGRCAGVAHGASPIVGLFGWRIARLLSRLVCNG